MDRAVHPSKITRCGVFEIDLKAFELRKHGLRLKLSEQPFQILAILLERPGEIVTRDELRERLWPGDDSSTGAIVSAVAAVTAAAPTQQLAAGINAKRWLTLPRIAFLSAAILAFAVLSGVAVHYVRGMESGKLNPAHNMSLVVLPLENLTGDQEQEYFADGMTDDLTANLAKIRSLRVISRSTAMAY